MIEFIDQHHQAFFLEHVTPESDVYHQGLYYLLGLTDDTRRHCSEIVGSEGINVDVLNASWVSGEDFRLLCLAFNLWNGYVPENNPNAATIDTLFSGSLGAYYIQAIKLRYQTDKRELNRRKFTSKQPTQLGF